MWLLYQVSRDLLASSTTTLKFVPRIDVSLDLPSDSSCDTGLIQPLSVNGVSLQFSTGVCVCVCVCVCVGVGGYVEGSSVPLGKSSILEMWLKTIFAFSNNNINGSI